MCAGVSFQVEGVVETFTTEGAQVALDVRMTLHVSVEKPLEGEGLGTEAAGEFRRIVRVSSVDRSSGRASGRVGSASSLTRLGRVVLRP